MYERIETALVNVQFFSSDLLLRDEPLSVLEHDTLTRMKSASQWIVEVIEGELPPFMPLPTSGETEGTDFQFRPRLVCRLLNLWGQTGWSLAHDDGKFLTLQRSVAVDTIPDRPLLSMGKTKQGDLVFGVGDKTNILRIKPDGSLIIHDSLHPRDPVLYNAFYQWIELAAEEG